MFNTIIIAIGISLVVLSIIKVINLVLLYRASSQFIHRFEEMRKPLFEDTPTNRLIKSLFYRVPIGSIVVVNGIVQSVNKVMQDEFIVGKPIVRYIPAYETMATNHHYTNCELSFYLYDPHCPDLTGQVLLFYNNNKEKKIINEFIQQ